MILNLIVLVLIILITAYLANQGMLSSLLVLATATFSSVLAMGLMETAQGAIAKFKPEYARSAAFLLVFILSFSVTRVAADMAVPKNIKLPLLINRAVGGIVGFVTALVVVGTLLIGFEMLPLPSSLVGYDRYPGPNAMQTPGKAISDLAEPIGVWMNPDRFVQAIWNGVSGRALGGSVRWASVHPDMSVESYGYRNVVPGGSQRVVLPELVQVPEVWTTDNAAEIQQRGIAADSGKRVVMVRTVVKKGDTPPHVSFDTDVNFRASATQVRLVTDKAQQYYPIGYLDQGRRFMKLTLDLGRVVDDYATASSVATEDWIFQIEPEEKPEIVELKQLARFNVAAQVKNSPTPALSASSYPQHPWLKDLCSVSVTFDPKGATTWSGHVYILKSITTRGDIDKPLSNAFDNIEKIRQDISDGANGWKDVGKPGIPSKDHFTMIDRNAKNMKTDPDDRLESWASILPILLSGQVAPNGGRNLEELPRFLESDVVGMWSSIRGNILVGSQVADASGKSTIDRIQTGPVTIVYTLQTDKGFYVWAQDSNLGKAAHISLKAAADSSDSSAILSIDMTH